MRALCLLTIGSLIGCASLRPQDRAERWFEVKTTHFALRADLGDAETQELAGDLERMRTGLLAAGWKSAEAPPGRLAVVVLRDRDELSQLAHERIQGFVTRDLLGERLMVLQADLSITGQSTLAHELAHVLTDAFLPHKPRWLSEGLATFLETIRLDEDKAWLGAPPPGPLHHLAQHGPLPSAQLLAWQHLSFGAENADLYASSWLLVNWLVFKRGSEFADYQRRLTRAEDPAAAWLAAFPGLTNDKLDLELREHLETRLAAHSFPTFALPLPKAPAGAQSSPLPAAEVHALWATLLLVSPAELDGAAREARARPELLEAFRLEPTNVTALLAARALPLSPAELLQRARAAADAHADDWRALTLLARTLDRSPGAEAEAGVLFERAANLAPDNPHALLDLARARLRHGRAADALAPAFRAVGLQAGDPYLLDTLAAVLIANGRCEEGVKAETRAVEVLPHDAPEQALHDLTANLREAHRRCP